MGNCCLAANWGYSGTCLAAALLRGANKGAFGYIGSCPETYWWEDYYFGVGATTVINSTPAMSQTQTGTYDAMFMDDMYNTLNSVPFLGNIAVAYAHANSYTSSVSDKYYWEATVRTGHGTTDWFQIGKGVRQGCILSPCLFNFYAEYIMRNLDWKKHSWNQDCHEKYQ